MTDNSRVFIGTAFLAGVVLTIGFKDLLYPELEQRLREYQARCSTQSKSHDAGGALTARSGPPAIVDGIEGCIGNTPLFRIKSLSDATGCEILGKAEVSRLEAQFKTSKLANALQFLNGAGQSSKDRVALSMIEIVCHQAN